MESWFTLDTMLIIPMLSKNSDGDIANVSIRLSARTTDRPSTGMNVYLCVLKLWTLLRFRHAISS